MNLPEILTGGIIEIWHHKLRAFLTLIGIILGCLSIIFMTSMLNGIILTLWKGFDQLGFDGVMYVVARQPKDSVERARFATSYGLRERDVDVLLSRRELVTAAAPVQENRLAASTPGSRREVSVLGVTPEFAPVRRRPVALGRFVTDNDMQRFARVCVVGHRLRLRLFGTADPLGRELELGGERFKVVGVGQDLTNNFVDDDDFIREMEGVSIPLATMRKYFTGAEAPLSYIAVKTTAQDELGNVQAEIAAALKVAHHGVGDFKVENIAQDIVRSRGEVKTVVRNWQIVLGTIAGIALLVGGIGLFSVMIISINERLYEIGMRKAIGATDLEIFLQFLMESVTLALTGALIGVGLGLVVVMIMSSFFANGLPVDWPGVTGAVGVAVTLGVLFGLYPALKAARMQPVAAMRG